MMARWTEQLERVGRWLRRAENQNREREEYEDDLWAFFQNCWHLKDWIKNDSVAAVDEEEIEREANSRHMLRVCADLANGTKHLELRNPREGGKLAGARIKADVRDDMATGTTTTSIQWNVMVALEDGTEYHALEVARGALMEWRDLIDKLKLT